MPDRIVRNQQFLKQNGSNNRNAKLSVDAVQSIINLYDKGEKQTAIAQLFGINQSQVSRIINHKTWNHVSAP